MNSELLNRVHHQILEGIKWCARNGGMNVTEILNRLEDDIMHGKYEKVELEDELKFWEK